MTAKSVTTSLNAEHLRVLASFAALFCNDGLPLTSEQKDALSALALATANSINGEALSDALARHEHDEKNIPRGAVLRAVRGEWGTILEHDLQVRDDVAMIVESRNDDKTVNGYWIEAWLYVSAHDVDSVEPSTPSEIK